LNYRLLFLDKRKVQGGLKDLKLTSNFGAGVRLVNFGSFVFCAVATCGWQNTEVPKFAVGCGGKEGLYLLETFMLARLRVSANVLQISEGTNCVGIVRGIWAFAYVLLSAALLSE
jgi:hypothetical protein